MSTMLRIVHFWQLIFIALEFDKAELQLSDRYIRTQSDGDTTAHHATPVCLSLSMVCSLLVCCRYASRCRIVGSNIYLKILEAPCSACNLKSWVSYIIEVQKRENEQSGSV